MRCRARYLENEFAAVTQQQGPSGSAERSVGEDISDIVKRECARAVAKAAGPGAFGKHKAATAKVVAAGLYRDRGWSVLEAQRLSITTGHRS